MKIMARFCTSLLSLLFFLFLFLLFMLNFLLLFCLRWGIFERDRDRDIVFSDCVCDDDMSVFHDT